MQPELLTLQEMLGRAVACHQAGNLTDAERFYRVILKASPDEFNSLHYLGLLKAQQGWREEAVGLIQQALSLNPQCAEAHANLGNVLLESKRPEDAVACFARALALQPGNIVTLFNHGNALRALKRYAEALSSYKAALAIEPGFVPALINVGDLLKDLKRYEEAIVNFNKALAISPDDPGIYVNLGISQRGVRHYEQALANYDKALALKPDYAEALNNRGNLLNDRRRYEQALANYDQALALRPDYTEALYNRSGTLFQLRRYEEAIPGTASLLAINPEYEYALGLLVHLKMHCCDWRDNEQESAQLIADVRSRKSSIEPFSFLSVAESAQDQLLCSSDWVRNKWPGLPDLLWRGARYRHDRIRLAYLSADLREHAVSHLLAGLFERHDRARFETIALSFSPDDRSEMRTRLMGAFERFIDVGDKSDAEIATMLRDLEVDIAVDLMGFTQDSRTGIFAFRAAPIQVNYLGYPGTMGADYIDYILADRIVIPEQQQAHYAEKVVYLPDSFQPNDVTRRIAERTPMRAQAGLPERGFVFCSFNNNYKITPSLFDIWMRLLREVDGSVLWLKHSSGTAAENLRREAVARGIDGARIVFATQTRLLEDHLARHRLADLFLDTLPYNAHTTASDALWAGLPVVTCVGTAFAGRVAASLLHAIGLPELVTRSLAEYEALALKLARDGELLAGIKAKLAQHRETFPLFDTDRFRRHLESAYITMWERYQRGEPPASFAVHPLPQLT